MPPQRGGSGPGRYPARRGASGPLPASRRAASRRRRTAREDNAELDEGRWKIRDLYPNVQDNILDVINHSGVLKGPRVLDFTTLSLRDIARQLKDYNTPISYRSVCFLMDAMGFEKLNNRRNTVQGDIYSDRAVQMRYVNAEAARCVQSGIPVVSVDVKDRPDLIYRSPDAGPRPGPKPRRYVPTYAVPMEDFRSVPEREVFAIDDNVAVMPAPQVEDVPFLAADCLVRWWESVGCHTFPRGDRIFVVFDYRGNPDADRSSTWEALMQNFADYTGRSIQVAHVPSCIWRWRRTAHRILSLSEEPDDTDVVLRYHAVISTITDREISFHPGPAREPMIRTTPSGSVWAEPAEFEPGFPRNWDYIIYPHGKEPLY